MVSIFALLGLAAFVICLLCILVLVRYRSMVPVMFALLLLQSLGGRLILRFLPIVRTGTPPGFYVNLVLLALMIIGLALSLWHPLHRHRHRLRQRLPRLLDRFKQRSERRVVVRFPVRTYADPPAGRRHEHWEFLRPISTNT